LAASATIASASSTVAAVKTSSDSAAIAVSTRWMCASVKPGSATSSGASSIRRVAGPASPSISARVPAAAILPRSIAIASTQP